MREPPDALDIAPAGFVVLDQDGRVRWWNRRCGELFGYAVEKAAGQDFAELVMPPRYRERHRDGLRRLLSSQARVGVPRTMQADGLRHDGSEFPIALTVLGVQEGTGMAFHGWIEDVSERAQLLAELAEQLRSGQPALSQVLDALDEAITIRDPHDHIIYANRAALSRMGFTSLEELQRRPPGAIMDDYIVHDESGRELTMDDVPSVRLLAGEAADPLVMRTVHRASGDVRWDRLRASLVCDQAGNRVAAVTIIEDITATKLSVLRLGFLAQATDTLMSSLEYEQTLSNVAWLAVPDFADWCAVDVVDEAGVRQRVVVAHRDPAKLALAEELRRLEPDQPDPTSGVGRVLSTGRPELYSDIPDELLAGAARDGDHLRLLRAVGMRSVVLVPLVARGRVLGVMTLVSAESRRRFGDADLEFAQQLAFRAAVAVDNARLASTRRTIARTLQRSLLPDRVPEIDGWEVATMYRAARAGEEVEVGGDFYDFFPTPKGWVVLLGDVTGKGVEAAAATSLVRHGAHFLSLYEELPSRILARLNEVLGQQPGLWLCSALCLRLHRDGILVASGGHPPPLAVDSHGRVREISLIGTILGAWIDEEPEDRWVPIGPGETLLLYTDGVVEARGEDDRFGHQRLRDVLAQASGAAPEAVLERLEAAIAGFEVGSESDDTAAVALRRSPAMREGQGDDAEHLGAVSSRL